MRGSVHNIVFRDSGVKAPNVFIGGVYPNSVSDAQDLANKFTFLASDVNNFTVAGSDISFHIPFDTITLFDHAFSGDSYINRFETSGVSLNAGVEAFKTSSLGEIIIDGVLGISERTFDDCYSLYVYNIIIDMAFPYGVSTTRAFANLPSIQPVEELKLGFPNQFGTGNPINEIFLNGTYTVDMRNIEYFDLYLSAGAMFQTFNGVIQLWKCLTLQPTDSANGSIVTGVFGNDPSTTMTIEINIVQKTINGGSPHADLVDAISRGATVIYTDDNGTIISTIPVDKLTYYAGCEGAFATVSTLKNWVNNENANDATILSLTPSLVGDGVLFGGATSRYKMPSGYDYSLLDSVNGEVPVSFGCIANGDFTNGGIGVFLMNKRNSSTQLEYNLTTNSTGQLSVSLFTNSSNRLTVTTTTSLTNNLDTYIEVTYDSSKTAAGIKIYVNGVLQSTTEGGIGTYTGMIKGTETLGLGHRNWNTSFGWAGGIIDEPHIFKDVELSQEQITDIYNKFLNGEHLIPEPAI